MKKMSFALLGSVVLVTASSLTAFAAGATLANGGLGQSAADATNFGVAVCATGAALTHAVPVSVTANGKTSAIESAAAIGAGACEYSYLPYSDLAMQPGQTYPVTVAIDGDSANAATYSVTVPQASVAAANAPRPLQFTANASAQLGNFFTMIGNWFMSFFR